MRLQVIICLKKRVPFFAFFYKTRADTHKRYQCKLVCTSPMNEWCNHARSQDLEKEGLFWKSEKSANVLDPKFHCSWISFTRFVRKLRRNFSKSSEIPTFFPPKIRWSPKKKKRFSPKLRLIFRPKSEIPTFFPPKTRWSPKKKKVFTEFETAFSAEIGISNVWGGLCTYGGLFSIFHKKSASKAPKTCDFAYFKPPSPPLATLLGAIY